MKRWLGIFAYLSLLLVLFGLSSYFWFTFFVRGRSVETPRLVGRSVAEARAVASDLGLILVVDNSEDRNSDEVMRDAVVWQHRSPGRLVKRGTRLRVGQSLGPLVLTVPDLEGQSPRTALLRLTQRNLQLGRVAYAPVRDGEGIVAEDPPKGTTVKAQTPVSLLVAVPPQPPTWVMPDLINRRLERVRPLFETRGFVISNIRYESYPGISDGTIIRQFPLPGGPVSERDPITLVVTRQEGAGWEEAPQ
jgi:eukaryotic-like serine/threonine-protein kinase